MASLYIYSLVRKAQLTIVEYYQMLKVQRGLLLLKENTSLVMQGIGILSSYLHYIVVFDTI